ncbi:MAG: YciI family protein [Thermomicrobiales bacterium]|jgi:uncharacterized protein YciI
MAAMQTFLVLSKAGPLRDLSKDSRAQIYWDEHAEFIDKLDGEGFILLGGPLVDEGGALLVVHATGEQEIREKLQADPWYVNGVLTMDGIKRWDIFIDHWMKA